MGHGRVVTERSANALSAGCSLSAQRRDADDLLRKRKKDLIMYFCLRAFGTEVERVCLRAQVFVLPN